MLVAATLDQQNKMWGGLNWHLRKKMLPKLIASDPIMNNQHPAKSHK